jgi:hypothetical protein
MKFQLIAATLTLMAAANVEARFGVSEAFGLQGRLSACGLPSADAGNFGGAGIGANLAARDPCDAHKIADDIVASAKANNVPACIAVAQDYVNSEKNFNPFAQGGAAAGPRLCATPGVPASPELQGILPLVDPATQGAAEQNTRAQASLDAAKAGANLPSNGQSVEQQVLAGGFSDFFVGKTDTKASAGGAPPPPPDAAPPADPNAAPPADPNAAPPADPNAAPPADANAAPPADPNAAPPADPNAAPPADPNAAAAADPNAAVAAAGAAGAQDAGAAPAAPAKCQVFVTVTAGTAAPTPAAAAPAAGAGASGAQAASAAPAGGAAAAAGPVDKSTFPTCQSITSAPKTTEKCTPSTGTVGTATVDNVNPFCFSNGAPAGRMGLCQSQDKARTFAVAGDSDFNAEGAGCDHSCSIVGRQNCQEAGGENTKCNEEVAKCMDFCKATVAAGRTSGIVPAK